MNLYEICELNKDERISVLEGLIEDLCYEIPRNEKVADVIAKSKISRWEHPTFEITHVNLSDSEQGRVEFEFWLEAKQAKDTATSGTEIFGRARLIIDEDGNTKVQIIQVKKVDWPEAVEQMT